jgi:methionyl-tRNA formyltransferase
VNPPAGLSRLVVMGTGPFALPLLSSLLASPHRVVALVTRPDRGPVGRRPPPNPMRQAAERAGLPVLDPLRVNDPGSVAAIADLEPDLLVVCDYGQILSAELLAVPPLGGINLHGSLLPRHRGAAPVQWTILEGDGEAGVSVFHMTPALDAGRVLAERRLAVGPRATAAELEARLAALGGDAVLEAIERLQAAVASGTLASVGAPQDPAEVTRAPRLAKADGVVDWSWPAARIERLRRALEPWPRATTFLPADAGGNRRRLVLEDVVEVDPREVAPMEGGPPGSVLSTGGGRLVVACGPAPHPHSHQESSGRAPPGTALEILRVVPEGRRSMSAAEFLRGSPLRPGDRLG